MEQHRLTKRKRETQRSDDKGGSDPREPLNSGLSSQDLERIAAFIDRRLSPEERREFMARLDAEEQLYEVFVETVRYRDQRTGRPAEVIDHPAGRWRWRQLAAVAALLAAAITPVVLLNLPGGRYAPSLVADGLLATVLEEEWYVKSWSVMRGPAPGTDEFDTAFRLGVRQVDLEVALRLGRVEDATYLTHEIESLLDSLTLAEVMQIYYAEVRQLADEPERALVRAEESDAQLRAFLGEAGAVYDLGQWAEAGVLAARGGNTDLLASRSFRRAPRDFPRGEWPELARGLDEIATLLEAPEDRMDLVRLEAAFTAIVDDR